MQIRPGVQREPTEKLRAGDIYSHAEGCELSDVARMTKRPRSLPWVSNRWRIVQVTASFWPGLMWFKSDQTLYPIMEKAADEGSKHRTCRGNEHVGGKKKTKVSKSHKSHMRKFHDTVRVAFLPASGKLRQEVLQHIEKCS